MATYYWVGGAGTWNASSTTNWASSSGGSGGAGFPTSADNVIIDGSSGTGTISVSSAVCNDLTVTATQAIVLGQVNGTLSVYGNLTFPASGSFSASTNRWTITFAATTTGKTITTNGFALASMTFNGVGGYWTLGSALSMGNSLMTLSVLNGTLDTSSSNYNLSIGSGGSNSIVVNGGTLKLNASNVTGTGNTQVFTYTSGTLNTGTSSISLTGTGSTGVIFNGGNQTYYNVTLGVGGTINGSNTFNNLTLPAVSNVGAFGVTFAASATQTINGTLTANGNNATYNRHFIKSSTPGTAATINAAALSISYIDFQDITGGGAATWTGTSLGDCKGNTNISTTAPKTVYWRGATAANFNSVNWGNADTGGSTGAAYFPLPQDTAVFKTYPNSGVTVTLNGTWNLGTIDMSNRTSNTMTLATSASPIIYGNWINGTGTTLSGTNTLTFSGRGSQTITSAGITFTQPITVNTVGGSVTLQDNFTTNYSGAGALTVSYGTFDANGKNVTLSGAAGTAVVSGTNTRTVAVGTGTWTIAGSGNAWDATTITGLTMTGAGTLSFTSASAKTFIGGGFQNYPTLDQGGAGALTISGSNKFANITNTYSATGATSVLFTAGTTNEFTSFNLTGASGKVCTLGSTTTSQAILKKTGSWLMGANSTNVGNNTGLTFSGGGGIDYLSVSYINGQLSAMLNGNFLQFLI